MAIWNAVKDGEYNEHTADIKSKHLGTVKVTVYSDAPGNQWHMNVNDGESGQLEADNLDDALKEAEKEAKQW